MLPVFHRAITRAAAVGAAALFVTAGCSKKADTTSNYTSAIDAYYAKQPACLWSDEVKFPLQVATADADKTKPYDALVDQGLLVRTSVEKKKLIVLSQQANNYDLSDKGRSAWTGGHRAAGLRQLLLRTPQGVQRPSAARRQTASQARPRRLLTSTPSRTRPDGRRHPRRKPPSLNFAPNSPGRSPHRPCWSIPRRVGRFRARPMRRSTRNQSQPPTARSSSKNVHHGKRQLPFLFHPRAVLAMTYNLSNLSS